MADTVDIQDEPRLVSEFSDDVKIPKTLPLLPVRDIVIFPFMVIPLFVGRDASIQAVNAALGSNRMLFLVAQKDASNEKPVPDDLYKVGVVGTVLRMLKLPDNRVKILVQGLAKAEITDYLQKEPYFSVKFRRINANSKKAEKKEKKTALKNEAMIRNARRHLETVINLGKPMSPDILVAAENIDEPGKLADLMASNLGLKVEDAQSLLETEPAENRLRKITDILVREIELLGMQQKIETAAQEEMTKTQREYFLREQLKAIQKELGEIDEKSEEINDFKEKIDKAKMPEGVEEEALKQLNRMSKMHTESAEATTVRSYLEWMVEIPWSVITDDNLNLRLARKVLEEDHYGLDKIKDRIVEYLAVRKLKDKLKGPIICFVGPPGTGKTSLGKSIARALGRKFVRISLGGVRDEAEIRGHRRTYIGALPGRIIQGLKQAGSANPVFMMDEIDKLGSDFRGDPSSALLEVLDPEQNFAFVDHYIGAPYDLSNVMFITTANMVETIPSALLDRMEVIRLSGYTEGEKLKIANKYLTPRQLKEHGITKKHLKISGDAILKIIAQYTREAGLRNLERKIATICRKVAKGVAGGSKKLITVEPKDLQKYLGVRRFSSEKEQEKDMVGVATGVAWTQSGGEIMHVEASVVHGSGRLILTGKLGDVMKESAQAALTYVRSRAKEYKIEENFLKTADVHIHVPAGAIPKDGPSAGVTIAVALVSALTKTPVRRDITMTGEITLRGRVLPIGGLKEKVLAAKRAGIDEIIIPESNKKDLTEIPANIRKEMKFHIAKTADKVLKLALVDKKPKAKK